MNSSRKLSKKKKKIVDLSRRDFSCGLSSKGRQGGAGARLMDRRGFSCTVDVVLDHVGEEVLIYQWIFIDTLTSGHDLCVEITDANIYRGLYGAESMRVLHGQWIQLRWLEHLIRTTAGLLPLELVQACQTGRRPRGRPGSHRRDYISLLGWERLGIPPHRTPRRA